jgi:hypothetical protein
MLLLLPFFDADCFLLLSGLIEAPSRFCSRTIHRRDCKAQHPVLLSRAATFFLIIFQQTVTLNVIVQTAVDD